jgi:hypothetical protein
MKNAENSSFMPSNEESLYDNNYKKSRTLRDKIFFSLNFIILIISIFAFFRSVKLFAYVNYISVVLMMIHRLYEFFCYKWQFYLVDFCYVVNTMVIIYSIFFPKNYEFFLTAFAFSTGPIFTAIAYYRMALVFHNTVKMTSQWTHYSPALTMFLIRWFDNNGDFLSTEELNKNSLTFKFVLDYFYSCSRIYWIWFFIYYLIIFHLGRDYIKRNGCETQYNYLMSKSDSRKVLMVLGFKWSEIVYMFTHVIWVYLNLALSLLQFFNFYFGAFLVCYITFASIWNATTYYIDYFSVHYDRQFLKEEIKNKTYQFPI